MDYIILIIAGILGVIIGRYLGRRRGVKKVLSVRDIQVKEKSEKPENQEKAKL